MGCSLVPRSLGRHVCLHICAFKFGFLAAWFVLPSIFPGFRESYELNKAIFGFVLVCLISFHFEIFFSTFDHSTNRPSSTQPKTSSSIVVITIDMSFFCVHFRPFPSSLSFHFKITCYRNSTNILIF